MAKYSFWQSSKSPLEVEKFNTDAPNTLGDWNRIDENISTVTIDGESLESLLRKDKGLRPTDPLPHPAFVNIR